MHHFTEKDFSKCVFNPMVAGNLFKVYPQLKTLTDEEGKEKERLLRYVIAMYDSGTPLAKSYPDLMKRKIAACSVAGVEGEKAMDDLFAHRNESVLKLICDYMRIYGQSRLWAMIVALEEQMWEFIQRLIKPVGSDKDKEALQGVELKSKISSELDTINQRLENYYAKLYGNDEDLISASKAKRLTPETIADVL
jgi:hypothetical protein